MILGDFSGCKVVTSRVLLLNMLAVAPVLIASKWKPSEVPSMNDWLSEIRYMALMNKLSAICACKTGHEKALANFTALWKLFLSSRYAGYQLQVKQYCVLSML